MVYKISVYDGCQIDEYLGKYSISAQKISKDKFYPVWARYQTAKDTFNDRAWPVRVQLGGKEMAIATLKAMIKEIESGSASEEVLF